MLNAAEIAVLENNIDNVWSLSDYLRHMNEDARAKMAANPGLWCSEFTEDLTHWNECGIHTARDLANYLDACFEKEVRKAAWDLYEDSAEAASEAAEAQEQNAWAQYVNQPTQGTVTLSALWPK